MLPGGVLMLMLMLSACLQVELFMRPQNIVLSSTKRGSHSVRWRETHEVTVQEPSSQVGTRLSLCSIWPVTLPPAYRYCPK